MTTISGYSPKPVIVREFGKVVDLLRQTGVVIGSTETSGKYTINSTGHGLSDFEVITIDSIDYVINEVETDSFVINGSIGLDFTDLTWKAKAPYYLFGHPSDIVNVLAERNKSAKFSYQKYPLIALFQDFDESMESGSSSADLKIIIANIRKPTYDTDDRYTYSFEAVLYPILAQLERALQVSKHIDMISNDYTKTDRAYWGKTGLYGNEGNIFDDHIDAIELNNLSLKFKNICK